MLFHVNHFQVMLLARIKTDCISDKYFVALKVVPFKCKLSSVKWKCSLVFHSRNELLLSLYDKLG